MSNIKDNILKAKNIINNYDVNTFDRIYPFSNENLAGCFEFFELENKKCLSVLGSSDQTLDMFLHNANSVTTFYVNPLTEYYFYLKLAALLSNFTYEEYLDFFCSIQYEEENLLAFNIKRFDRISQHLHGDSYKFWSALYDEYGSLASEKLKNIFMLVDQQEEKLKNIIGYLDPKNYYLLTEKAKNIKINFIHTDIRNLANKLNEKYNLMYLANIIQYAGDWQDGISLNENHQIALKKYEKMIYDLSKHLYNKGKIAVGYIFKDYDGAISPNLLHYNEIFNNNKFSFVFFTSAGCYATNYLFQT